MTKIPETTLEACRFLEQVYVNAEAETHAAYSAGGVPTNIGSRTDLYIDSVKSSVSALEALNSREAEVVEAIRIAGSQAINDCLHLCIPALGLLEFEGIDTEEHLGYLLRSPRIALGPAGLYDGIKNKFLKVDRYNFVDEGLILSRENRMIDWQPEVSKYFYDELRKQPKTVGCPALSIKASILGEGVLVSALWRSFCSNVALPN